MEQSSHRSCEKGHFGLMHLFLNCFRTSGSVLVLGSIPACIPVTGIPPVGPLFSGTAVLYRLLFYRLPNGIPLLAWAFTTGGFCSSSSGTGNRSSCRSKRRAFSGFFRRQQEPLLPAMITTDRTSINVSNHGVDHLLVGLSTTSSLFLEEEFILGVQRTEKFGEFVACSRTDLRNR